MQQIYSQTCQCLKKLWDIKQKSVIHTQGKRRKRQEKPWDFLGKDSEATIIDVFKELNERTSLAVQWLRIHLAMQGMRVWSLVRGLRSQMPWSNYWTCVCSGAHKPQLEIPHAETKIQGRQKNKYYKQINVYRYFKIELKEIMFKIYKTYASYNNFYKSKRRYDNKVASNKEY